jgi:hypothetical protein
MGIIPTFSWTDGAKTMKPLSQDSRCPDRDSNQAAPVYKSEALAIASTCSVKGKVVPVLNEKAYG